MRLPLLAANIDGVSPALVRWRDVEAEALAVLAEEFELRTAVVINEENILTVVAALNNVLRLTRNDDSGRARHTDKLPIAGRKVNK